MVLLLANSPTKGVVTMLNKFKNTFINELVHANLPQEHIDKVLSALAVTLQDFDMKAKESNLVIYDGGNVLDQAITAYINCKRAENCSPASVKYWSIILPKLLSYVRKAPQDYTSFDIRAILAMHSQSSKISGRTLNKYRQIIHGFFQWLVDEQFINSNPCRSLKPIRTEKKELVSLTQMDMEVIRQNLKTPREHMLIELLYSTGCRATEVCNIKVSDLNLERGTVRLFGKGRKERTSFLNAKAIVAIKKYLESRDYDSEWLFSHTRSPHGKSAYHAVSHTISLINKRVKNKVSLKLHPHLFRHTTATIAANNGMPIQEVQLLLGHASINTTMLYAKVNKSSLVADHQKFVN